MLDFLAISLGAVVGANARFVLSRNAAKLLGPVFPYGTLIINTVGSFIVGFFVIWTTERVLVDPRWRLLVVVGFCGGFTTFSSFAFETLAFFRTGSVAAHGNEYPRPETCFAWSPHWPAWACQVYCKMQDAMAVHVTTYLNEAAPVASPAAPYGDLELPVSRKCLSRNAHGSRVSRSLLGLKPHTW